MSEPTSNTLLEGLLGDWQGITRLHSGQGELREHSSGAWLRCVRAGGPGRFRLRYVWTLESLIREGHLLIAVDGSTGRASAAWMDSGLGGDIGGGEVLALRGWLDATGLLRLSGHGGEAPGKLWTWRLELDCPEPARLELRLYTTSPQGEEELAASAEYRR